MAWWLILLILLAAFGPVLWILPSKRDRLLTRLRAGARARGILVELTRLRDLAAPLEERVSAGGVPRTPTRACAAYRQAIPRSVNHAPRWRLLRDGDEPGQPVAGWTFDGERAGDRPYWQEAALYLDELPDDVLAVEVGRNQVSLFWRERVAAEEVEAVLDRLATMLVRLAEWHHSVEQRELERLQTDDSGDL